MSEEEVPLVAGGRRLSARLLRPAGVARGSIAIAHPHPAHGGHMDHSVVVAVAERAARAGLAAVRFDFGGVRGSEGDVRDWERHQEDLRAAFAAARAAAPPGAPTLGAGYSYGARSWLEAVRRPDAPRVAGLLLCAPPTRVPSSSREFGNLLLGRPLRDGGPDAAMLERLAAVTVPTHVLVGSLDVVAPSDELRAHVAPHVVVTVLPGLDHFFRAREPGAGDAALALASALDDALAALLPPATR